MPHYKFEYIEGSSKPEHTVDAENDWFAYIEIANFLAQNPVRVFVEGSIVMTDYRKIGDPTQPWSTLVIPQANETRP